MGVIRTWDLSNLEEVVKTSISWADVCRKMGRPPGGSSQATVIRYAKKLGLDFSHFDATLGKSKSLLKSKEHFWETILKDAFVENSTFLRQSVKACIIKFSLLKYECVICKCDGNWQNSTISLQLDHINGINNDHRISNLRFLCPNCHAATPTYCGKVQTKVLI